MLAGAVRRLRHFRLSDSNGILQAKNVAFAGAELPIGPLSEAVLNAGETCIECRVTVGRRITKISIPLNNSVDRDPLG